MAEIEAQIATIDHYVDAAASRPADPDLLTQLGLWDTSPDVDLAQAASAFAAGDLESSVRAADVARTTWLSAANVGQGRAIIIGAVVLGLLLLLVLGIVALGRRRRGRRAAAAAAASAPVAATGTATATGGEGIGLTAGLSGDAMTAGAAIDPDATETDVPVAAHVDDPEPPAGSTA
jgi:uncharacterized iron-regulated membrane protein